MSEESKTVTPPIEGVKENGTSGGVTIDYIALAKEIVKQQAGGGKAEDSLVDPLKDVRDKKNTQEEYEQYHNIVSSNYAEVLSEFKSIFKDSSSTYLDKISNLKLEEKINALAKEIIIKSKGDTEGVRALISSISKQDVFDKNSAFSVHYNEAIGKLKDVKNPFYVPNSSSHYSAKDLEDMNKLLFNSKTREQGIQIAKNLKLIQEGV